MAISKNIKPNDITRDINGITYFKLKSDIEGDRTKNCGLYGEDVDKNFYYLRGRDIDSISVDSNKNIIIKRVDKKYKPLKINIENTDNYNIFYNKETGVLSIKFPDIKKDIETAVDNANIYTDNQLVKLKDVYTSKKTFGEFIGDNTGKTLDEVVATNVVKIIDEGDLSLEKLKEIANWIINDTTGAAAMANDVAALKAIKSDTRLDALEEDTHTHENKSILDTISKEKVREWTNAEENAKRYADNVILNTFNELTDYVDDELSDYATKSFVTEQIISAMTGSSIELSGYAKVEDVKDYVRSGVTDSKAYTNNKIKELSNVYASKSTVDSLIGKDTNKTIRKVAAEEVAKIVASANTKYDTLKEIADWITNDTTGAAAMANDIAVLKKETHTHTNKSVIDSITPEKIAAWESAVEKINSLENIVNSLIKEYIINNVKGKEYEISINYSDEDKKHTISFDNNAIFGIIPE